MFNEEVKSKGRQMNYLFLILLMNLLSSQRVFSWGGIGHETVAILAWQKLSIETQTKIKQILDTNESLATASIWPDKVKRDPKWSFTSFYHYADRSKDLAFEDLPIEPKGDAIRALYGYEKILRSNTSTNENKKFALRFIVHLVGDLHQPLHAGYIEDKGANLIAVTFFGGLKSTTSENEIHRERGAKFTKTNLHSVWDTGMIMEDMDRNCKIFESEQVRRLRSFSNPSNGKIPPSEAYSKCIKDSYSVPGNLLTIHPFTWLGENKKLFSRIYDFENQTIDEDYFTQNIGLIRQQMLIAASRLAYILENDLKNIPTNPENIYWKNYLTKIQAVFKNQSEIKLLPALENESNFLDEKDSQKTIFSELIN